MALQTVTIWIILLTWFWQVMFHSFLLIGRIMRGWELHWKGDMHWPKTDTLPSSHKGRPRSDNQRTSQAETRDHSIQTGAVLPLSPAVLWFHNYGGMFSCSDARNCRTIQRRLAAERIEEELGDWRRAVDAYKRVVCDLMAVQEHIMHCCTI